MIFPNRIKSIRANDRVLDIGPGNSPHPRADILLENQFDVNEAFEQRGRTTDLRTTKPVVFFDGETFPFQDKEFDYIICSHVLEHVPDVNQFLSEVFRVGKAGYFEFPSIYYEYLYNFPVHLQLLHYTGCELRFMKKNHSQLNAFISVQKLFYRSLELGYADLVNKLKTNMFIGFEWKKPFPVREVEDVSELTSEILPAMPNLIKKTLRRILQKIDL
jgi:SAM-dependent methyltransferase